MSKEADGPVTSGSLVAQGRLEAIRVQPELNCRAGAHGGQTSVGVAALLLADQQLAGYTLEYATITAVDCDSKKGGCHSVLASLCNSHGLCANVHCSLRGQDACSITQDSTAMSEGTRTLQQVCRVLGAIDGQND